jgi:hypothetical protein
MQFDAEAEPFDVEPDRRIDVVDDLADADSAHRSASLMAATTSRPAHHGRPAHHSVTSARRVDTQNL